MQPLDISVFGPFKSYYNAAVGTWILQNPGVPMTIYEVAKCIGEAHPKAFTPVNIILGFRRSGIFPMDRFIFSEADFLPSAVTDRPLENPTDDKENNMDISTAPAQNKETTGSNVQPAAKTSESSSANVWISPEQFRGLPKALPRKTNRKPMISGKSKIITDTPEKELLIEKDKLRETNRRKQEVKKVKRAIVAFKSKPKKMAKKVSSDESSESDKYRFKRFIRR